MKETNTITANNENIEIPIVFITDNNYALPTGVAIRSLVLNKKPKTIYKIFVIITENITAENKRKLTKCGRKKAHVNLIECDTGVLNEYVVPGYHVPPCDLLKFNIPGLLPQYEKILYIDGDILANGDLTELYSMDISDAYLGAVSDMAAVVMDWPERLGTAGYFNAGVMLLNSARMRREGFEEKLYRIKKQNPDYVCMDQDVFNVAVRDEVVYFPVKYNVMLHNFLHPIYGGIEKLNEHYGTSYKSFDALKKDAVIVHLTNEYKPWKYKDAVMHKKWMSYFKKSPFRTQKLSLTYSIMKKTLYEIIKLNIEIFIGKMKRMIKRIIKNLPFIKQTYRKYSEFKNLLLENNAISKEILAYLKKDS